MSTITALVGTDGITTANSMTKINTNFSNLNTDKIETSVLDTDNTLAANSDSKIATQKAVKTYVDAGGNVNASETTKGIVEEATDAEVTAGTATGGTGAKLFVTPAKLATRVTAFTYFSVAKTGYTTRDISTANGTQTIAHGLGKTPVLVVIHAEKGATNYINKITSTYDGTTQFSHSLYWDPDTTYTNLQQATFRFFDGTNESFGAITVDATNISITWTKNGSPTGTAYLIWEAIA